MSNHRALVIGAGVGGLALAIYLAEHGLEVEIVEKREGPGGRCGRLERDGHRFDVGATLLLMPRLCRSIFADWGEDLDAQLDLRPLDPIYTLYFEERGPFAFSADREHLREEMERLEPGSWARWQGYDDLGRRQYRVLMRRFLGRNFEGPADYFTLSNLLWFFRLQAHRRHFRLTARFLRTPELRAAFTFQNIYVGQSPFSSSAAYALLPAMELEQGGWYPVGGMHRIVERLVALCEQRGVRIRYDAEVAEVLVRHDTVAGVRLADGRRLPAGVVAANADLPYVYRSLLPPSREGQRLRRRRYASSALVFHWGLDEPLYGLGHHNIFLGRDYEEGFRRIFHAPGSGPPTHFYVNRPGSTDPSCAPPGRDTVSVIVPAPRHDPDRPLDWAELRDRTRDLVLERLAAEGFPDLERRIALERCFTPPDWQRALNLTHGSVFGSLDHGVDQVGWLRPANRHARIRGLYFVGGSTRPGSGVPLVLLSGRLTAERILRDRGVPPAFDAYPDF